MSKKIEASLFDSFNARNLSYEQVGRSFVPYDDFYDLQKNMHTVIMGPRGCGKTTMLKMLTLPAQRAWKKTKPDGVSGEISFYGVYIPTDIQWHHQLTHSVEELKNFPQFGKRISIALVTTNVLNSYCFTLQWVLENERLLGSKEESDLTIKIANVWALKIKMPCLASMATALKSRVNDIRMIQDRVIENARTDENINDLPDYLYIDYLPALDAACEVVDEVLKIGNKKWALCFDELELAPGWLKQKLFAELRSTSQRFLFKLSSSPVADLDAVSQAKVGHDFNIVRLWPSQEKSYKKFFHKLSTKTLKEHYSIAQPLEDILEVSPFAEEKKDTYERGSKIYNAMLELARFDRSFSSLLRKNGVSPENPTTTSRALRDSVLRKAKPLVLQRNAYLKATRGGGYSVRSRKIVTLYSGADIIYEMCDGNPRWLIGVINELMKGCNAKQDKILKKIPNSQQARVLRIIAERFSSLIRTLPEASEDDNIGKMTLHELVERLGNKFFHAIVYEEFKLDPICSFIVDKESGKDIVQLVRKGVDIGAFILVNPDADEIGSEIIGRRFRLTHLLAPEFGLPVRLYDSASLSACIGKRKRGKIEAEKERETPEAIQEKLPLWE